MLSGGADSACLVAGLAALIGTENLDAVHINYRLRPDSDEDEVVCRDLCARLRVDLRVERPSLPPGNVQSAARDVRYAAAERLRRQFGADWIATGHNRSDLAETMIYRLAVSPGRRPLLGLAPRRGRILRPLLGVSRERLRELARQGSIPYKDDPSNLDPRFARSRIRAEVLPVMSEISAEYERNMAATWRELAEEADALESIAAAALTAGGGAEPGATPVSALTPLHPAVRRIAMRILAERMARHSVAVGPDKAEEIWRVATRPQGGVVDLAGGVRAICESGWLVFAADQPGRREAVSPTAQPTSTPEPVAKNTQPVLAPDAVPPPATRQSDSNGEPSTLGGPERSWPDVALPVPGSCRWGRWQLQAELRPGRPRRAEGPDIAMLDAAAIGPSLIVRGWLDGDRIRPLGLEGSKSLQDLFTDRGVPRSHRRLLPVVLAGDEIAWVAGLAIGERFKLRSGTEQTVVITATPIRT